MILNVQVYRVRMFAVENDEGSKHQSGDVRFFKSVCPLCVDFVVVVVTIA